MEEKDGRIAGMLMCSRGEKELSFLAVHPEYRKKGVAKRLIEKMTEWFTAVSYTHLVGIGTFMRIR